MGFFDDVGKIFSGDSGIGMGIATAVNPLALLGTVVGTGGQIGSAFMQNEAQRDANTANAMQNEKQMLFNSQQSELNRNFEERMSNSAWQRGVADMKAAGINPMGAYASAGASSPSGGAASAGSMGRMEPVPSWLGGFVSSAMDAMRTFADVSLKNAETIKARSSLPNIEADTELKYQDALHKTMLNKEIDANLPSSYAHSFTESNRMKAESKFPGFYGNADAILRRLGLIGTAAKAAIAYKVLKGSRYMYGAGDKRPPWRAYGVEE